MKTIFFAVIIGVSALTVLPASSSFAAFPSDEISVLEQKDIAKLPDDKLLENYIDVLTEMEATKAFHATSGFTPKEYKKYKEIVKYRIQILFEIHRRKLEIPPALD
jgi:hypothetical protein